MIVINVKQVPENFLKSSLFSNQYLPIDVWILSDNIIESMPTYEKKTL